jgi:zinc/manganese transport system ATP-binding protein
MSNLAISLNNIKFGYTADAPIFENLSASLIKGSYVGINGRNGSGKSTLLKLILGLIRPITGKVETKTKQIAYVPQNANFDRTFPISIGDMLKMAKFVNPKANTAFANLQKALIQVRLKKPLECPIQALSGGQFQRVIFARMLLLNPDLLVLDEPFNGIDEETIEDLAEVLKTLHAQGKTILLAVHDSYFLKTHVPEIMEINNGKLMQSEAK